MKATLDYLIAARSGLDGRLSVRRLALTGAALLASMAWLAVVPAAHAAASSPPAVEAPAASAEQPADPLAALKERVTTYWTAQGLNDLYTMYRLETAARPGGWLTPEKVHRGWPLRNPRIKDIQLKGDSATVTVEGEVTVLPNFPPRTELRVDDWLLIEGEWYHKTRQIRGPKTPSES